MAVTTEQITRLEDRVNDLTKETSELRGVYSHLAAKENVAKVAAKIDKVAEVLTWRMIMIAFVAQALGIGVLKCLP